MAKLSSIQFSSMNTPKGFLCAVHRHCWFTNWKMTLEVVGELDACVACYVGEDLNDEVQKNSVE